MKIVLTAVVCATAALAVAASAATIAIDGPAPYLSFKNSPFKQVAFLWFYLETFEGYKMQTPGVSYSGDGLVLADWGDYNDSVDADDGVIDGFGCAGASLWAQGDPGITIKFDRTVLGDWPTHAGVVWTDGCNPVCFQAFDGLGNSLGGINQVCIADDSSLGTTGEDRFFGVESSLGISMMHIWSGAACGIEIDHVQYGRAAAKRVVGLTNRATRDPVMAAAKENFQFTLWGEVAAQDFGATGFIIDDGTGAPVRVRVSSHSAVVGNYVRATGTLDTLSNPPTLTCDPGNVSALRQ